MTSVAVIAHSGKTFGGGGGGLEPALAPGPGRPPVCRLMLVSTMIVPVNVVLVPSVSELPT